MPKLAELDADVRVAFFGKWDVIDPSLLLKVEAPDPEELCYRCIFAIGSRTTGASVRTDDGNWVHYHRDCYYDAVQESTAHNTIADTLEADDLDDFP